MVGMRVELRNGFAHGKAWVALHADHYQDGPQFELSVEEELDPHL